MSPILSSFGGVSSRGFFKPTLVVTGGTLTSDATYYYRTFTANDTLGVANGSLTADLLITAGGGGGGDAFYIGGGGGGAGGVLSPTNVVLTQNNYPVVIGAGGAGGWINDGVRNGVGFNGVDTTISTYTAIGGGGGSGINNTSLSWVAGGSGGGGSAGNNYAAGIGTSGQGNNGGICPGNPVNTGMGGGGGAGAVGGNGELYYPDYAIQWYVVPGGNGGTGVTVFGRTVGGGGGGGAGHYNNGYVANGVTNSVRGLGGSGGGGNAARGYRLIYPETNTAAGTTGTINTGGGGGGGQATINANASVSTYAGKSGGSGIVVVRYTRAQVGG